MAARPRPGSPPGDRRGRLAELETSIAKAEATCARYRAENGRRDLSDRRRPQVDRLLRFAEERVAQLRASREILLRGEGAAVGDEPSPDETIMPGAGQEAT